MKISYLPRLCTLAAGCTLALTLGLTGEANADSFALGYVQNETPGNVPNGDYAIDYLNVMESSPQDLLAFSPMISIPTLGTTTLSFKAFVGDEWDWDPALADQLAVWASTDGTSIGYNLLASSSPSLGGVDIPEWGGVASFSDVVVDLSAYAGQVIYLGFSFDPLDDVNNLYPGVRIDNIGVTNGSNTLFYENFEDGVADGFQMNGLWHVTQNYVVAVPEPEAYAMMLAGLGLVGWAARRKQTC